MAINESKLNEFLGKAVGDLGAALSATLVLVGDRLGLYKELAKGAVTSAELARRTGTNERYVREWLGNQGASGYVQYDAANGKWSMTPFDCLHDMGDPVGVARHARQALKPDGTAMIVEPFANDKLQDNLNPVGRVMYAASSQICVPVSLARKGPALGAQAGEARLREVVVGGGGFARFRRATQTPFNLVLEARP
jgi:hypothetical protein